MQILLMHLGFHFCGNNFVVYHAQKNTNCEGKTMGTIHSLHIYTCH